MFDNFILRINVNQSINVNVKADDIRIFKYLFIVTENGYPSSEWKFNPVTFKMPNERKIYKVAFRQQQSSSFICTTVATWPGCMRRMWEWTRER
jgi:hypothetical protein